MSAVVASLAMWADGRQVQCEKHRRAERPRTAQQVGEKSRRSPAGDDQRTGLLSWVKRQVFVGGPALHGVGNTKAQGVVDSDPPCP